MKRSPGRGAGAHGPSLGILGLLQVAALGALALACERTPDLDDPSTFDDDGIAFSFPGNWSVDEDLTEPGEYEFRHIVVQSPGAALVMVQRFRPSLEWSIEDYAKQLMDATIEEADSLIELGPIRPLSAASRGSQPVRSMVAGAIRDSVESRFDMKAFGESVPHRVRAFKIEAADATVFLVTQAAIEDWSKVAPGFDLIAETLSVD